MPTHPKTGNKKHQFYDAEIKLDINTGYVGVSLARVTRNDIEKSLSNIRKEGATFENGYLDTIFYPYHAIKNITVRLTEVL